MNLNTGTVVFVVGARPNFIKIAPLLRVFDERFGSENRCFVHTGQHYDYKMSKEFFDKLNIPEPDIQFGGTGGLVSQGMQVASILAEMDSWLFKIKPRGVVVVGDVNSTLASSLSAVKLNIPVAHVEAGLRSFDRSMPEEINRILTDAISNLLFTSEISGVKNLKREGSAGKIFNVGNVMIDTLKHEWSSIIGSDIVDRLNLKGKKYALATFHRPSNIDEPGNIDNVTEILYFLSSYMGVVFPMHPRTKSAIIKFGYMAHLEKMLNLHLMEPLSYHDNLSLMKDATLVATDSGGIQEETSYLGVPCLTFRKNTERPVTLERGTNILVGDNSEKAKLLVLDIMRGNFKKGEKIKNWDGKASERIVDIIKQEWF